MIRVRTSDLTAYPHLVPWLVSGAWKQDFPPDQLSGKNLVLKSLETIDPDDGEAGDGDLAFVAEIRDAGNRRIRVAVVFFLDDEDPELPVDFITECSCPREYSCKHGAFGLQMLAHLAARVPKDTAPAPRQRLSRSILTWLSGVRTAGESAATPQPPSAKPYNKFLAYCIELHLPGRYTPGPPRLMFSMRMGSRSKTGELNVESSHASGDPTKPAKYMAREDLAICALIHARKHELSIWGSELPLSGSGWEEILAMALATGRLFFVKHTEDYRSSRVHHLLTEAGPPIDVDAAWQLMDDGSARPILSLPSTDYLIASTDPLIYVNPVIPAYGPVHSPTPHEVLAAWANGPDIPADLIPDLNVELRAIAGPNPLPTPTEKESVTISGLTPTPVLKITEVAAGVFLKRHIGGLVRFLYQGCPDVHPNPRGEFHRVSWIENDVRKILERDEDLERKIWLQLIAAGLSPIHSFYGDHDLNEKNRSSVVLENLQAKAADWLAFLTSPAAEELVENGWIIETDPKLGLTIHDIGDFFPAIEEDPNHGIDWFRFDVTGEFGGRRVSLIPQLARAIAEDWTEKYRDPQARPEFLLIPCENPADGHIRFPANRFLEMVENVRHLFHGTDGADGPLRLDRLGAAGVADSLNIASTETTRSLAELGRNLRDIHGLPAAEVPPFVKAELRPYQLDGFRWLQFLSTHGLHGILADDMGLGKTLQTLAHLAALRQQHPGEPSLVIAPTSVVPNWAAEAAKFAPELKVLVLHGSDRADRFDHIATSDLVLTSYPLLVRDFEQLESQNWRAIVLDEAQYIKNPKSISTHCACKLKAAHRLCLSGTPMENHLGELWSLMRFLLPGFLADEKTFNTFVRRPIERDRSRDAQAALNRRVAPLILRRTKDQVATELPEKTTIIHGIDLTPKQTDLYESVRAAMDKRVREAISSKGLAQSHIIVLDALLKLRQICCHPQLLKSEAAQRVLESAKLEFLTTELLPQLIEEGRRILLFSQFTSMLELIEEHLQVEDIPYLKLTGQTKERADLVKDFQSGRVPVFLISLKAGGTGLNLTAADTVIHYDPWWNPAAENQATDRAHRIGQTKPVFVHKLVCRGTIEDRILDLQQQKAALVEALLSEDTSKLKIDAETLSHLLSPVG